MNKCSTCPFRFNEASENAVNLGCLPDTSEIIRMRENGKTWACHDNQDNACAGAIEALKKLNKPCEVVKPLLTLKDNYQPFI